MDIRKLLLVAFVFSGIAALVYELTWIRPLQFLLGSTVYTISIIFAVFMLGLALGAYAISKYSDGIKDIPRAYALIEIGIGLCGILLLSIFNLLPRVYNSLYSLHTNFYLFEAVQFLLIFIVLLVPTTLMGATFSLISKFYVQEKIGKGIGEVYAANNMGAIIGSFSAGFILIPLFGIRLSIIFAGSINLLIGLGVLFAVDKEFSKKLIPIALALFLALAFVGDYNIKQMHSGGFYRTDPRTETMGDVVYYKEGLYSTVSVRELPVKGYSLFINGYGQGSYEISDLRVNFLLSYLPLLINPEIKKSLLIGLGTGTTAGQLAQLTDVKTIEIEPAIVDANTYFNVFNLNVLENKNHKLVIGDGRNYLLKDKAKYDAIISEPTNTWQSFSTQLYSKEFLELVSNHLNEDGLFVNWIPIYTMNVEDFKNVYRTFNSVFPYVVAFANIKEDEDTPVKFETSQIILIGSKGKIAADKDRFDANYNSLPELSKKYLEAIRLGSGEEIHHLLLFNGEEMQDYANDAKVLVDDKPILEFSTAKKVLNQEPKKIIEDIDGFIKK